MYPTPPWKSYWWTSDTGELAPLEGQEETKDRQSLRFLSPVNSRCGPFLEKPCVVSEHKARQVLGPSTAFCVTTGNRVTLERLHIFLDSPQSEACICGSCSILILISDSDFQRPQPKILSYSLFLKHNNFLMFTEWFNENFILEIEYNPS